MARTKPPKKSAYKENPEAEAQIEATMKTYDYDSLEYPIEVIVSKYRKSLEDEDDDEGEGNVIYVPDYQREYVWSPQRKSKFIESILIGVPIPAFFFADVSGRLEIVDGSQRIRTLDEFISGKLKLKELESLTLLNGLKFTDLSPTRRRRFLNKGLRAISLSEATDIAARLDLFERLNTGSDELRAAEIRKGAYAGEFGDFLKECAENPLFLKLCPIGKKVGLRAEGTERILRFFAYTESLAGYKGNVALFLDKYMKATIKSFNDHIKDEMQAKFENMLNFVDQNFPYGFRKFETAKSTPRVRFEAISIGVSNALSEHPDLRVSNVSWIDSEKFKVVTRSDAANNKSNLEGRIGYVKDILIEGQ